MASNGLVSKGIAHFIWDEHSTAQDYEEYMEVFESVLITQKIIASDATTTVDGATGSQRAKSALIVCGGKTLLKSIRAITDYKTMTYAALRTALDTEYVGVTPLQALSRFNRCKPTNDEKLTDYIKRLKLLATVCTRGDDKSMLAHISQYYPDHEVARQCMKADMTVSKLVTYAINQALNEKEYQPETSKSELNRIQADRVMENKRQYFNKYMPPSRGGKVSMSRPRLGSDKAKCSKCERTHPYGQCPAYSKQCHNCFMMNHFASCCTRPKANGTLQPARSNPNLGAKPKPNTFINQIDAESSDDEIFFRRFSHRHITSVNNIGTCPMISIDVGGTSIKFVVDTGAVFNLISKATYLQMEPKPTLIPSLRRMYAFDSDEQIPILGSFEQTIAMNNITALILIQA